VTGWASVHGYPVGMLANAPRRAVQRGGQEGGEFILLANQSDTPLVFLQNTTGYMVGTSTSRAGSSRTAPR
jgi:acetyl-CoA carboxylase carboxyltransferase component